MTVDPIARDRLQRRLQWLLVAVGVCALGAVAMNAVSASHREEARETSFTVAAVAPDPIPVSSKVGSPLPSEGRVALPLGGLDPERAAPGAGGDSFDCLIEPYYVIDIGSPVTGVIESLAVERGNSVEKGQVLVQLESGVERAAVAVASGRADMDALIQSHEARVTLGEQRKQRADKLFAGDALSRDRSEEAETEAIVARHELEQAREKMKLASLELDHALALLQRRSIRSPVSGVVVERLMAPGEVVDDETVLQLAKLDPLRVQVVLPGARFGSFRVGEQARVQPELPGASAHEARVVLVDRVIDAASGTFGVQLELPNPNESIPGGVHCQVRFGEE